MSQPTNYLGYPVHDGETLTAEDCSRCGLPTLVGEFYGVGPPVRLDALPLRTFKPSPLFGAYVELELDTRYAEHVCPLEGH